MAAKKKIIRDEFKEILLKIEKPVLDGLGRMLMLRKMTGNDIGEDYEFGVLVFTSIMAGHKEITITKKKRRERNE